MSIHPHPGIQTTTGILVLQAVEQGDVHRARLLAQGRKLSRADLHYIRMACRRWGATW